MPHKRIAIIGAGFAGLATTWHLLQKLPCDVTIFDASGVGGGASGIAAGLMHPYANARAKLNKLGWEGMQASHHLLDMSSQALGEPVATASGILRLAMTDLQRSDFAECAQSQPNEWWPIEKCAEAIPSIGKYDALWIPSGVIVDSRKYLKGLWLACKHLEAKFEKTRIDNLSDLQGYDAVIVAAGAGSLRFPELSHLGLTTIKGQLLEIAWPENVPRLPFALNSKIYLVMNPDGKSCVAGATFERDIDDPAPNVAIAAAEILPEALKMMPALEGAQIISCRAELRTKTPNRMPIAQRIDKKHWVIAGFGSKGLLYHALYAKHLAEVMSDEL